MINFDTYRNLYAEARQYDSIDHYVMERGWQPWMDSIGDADQIADLLRDVYTISRGGIDGILSVEGGKLTDFCKRYCLPYSTVQKWKLKETATAEHTLLLLGYAVLTGV